MKMMMMETRLLLFLLLLLESFKACSVTLQQDAIDIFLFDIGHLMPVVDTT